MMKLVAFILSFGCSHLVRSSWLPDTMKRSSQTTRALPGIIAMILGLAVQVQAQSFLTNGLTAHYPFNGNANDASGNGNNGTVNGATLTADRFGDANRAYRFNGASWVQLPDAILPVAPSELTLSVWVLADSGPYTTTEILTELSPRTGTCSMGAGTGHWGFSAKLQNSGWQPNYPPMPMITNMWVQLVGIYKQGQYVEFYVNGSLAYSNAIPDEILETNPTFPLNSAIGIYDYAPGPYNGFNGAIDDVRVYNRALSAAEVQQLYAIEAMPSCVSPPAGLVAWWPG
jgi:hypothetical protein